MIEILNYKTTNHFEERMSQREIDPFLISICLSKGEIKQLNDEKKEFRLKKEKLKEAISLEYLSIANYLGLESLTVVVKRNILITVFVRYSDSGLNYQKKENYA